MVEFVADRLEIDRTKIRDEDRLIELAEQSGIDEEDAYFVFMDFVSSYNVSVFGLSVWDKISLDRYSVFGWLISPIIWIVDAFNYDVPYELITIGELKKLAVARVMKFDDYTAKS